MDHTNNRQSLQQQQRERQRQWTRNRRSRMSMEQRQEELARRRANYRQDKEKGKQVETSCTTGFQETHDNEVGPNIGRVIDIPHGSAHFQGTHDHEAGPSRRPINENVHDDDNIQADTNYTELEIPNVHMVDSTDVASSSYNQAMRYKFQSAYNSARNFRNNARMAKSQLPPPRTCRRCNARLFYHESLDMCCSGGKVLFEQVNAPQELLEMFSDSSAEGREFRQHIRSYNHVLSFTSLGVHIDQNLASGRGVYTFRAQGSIYHKIGGFYPNEGSRPRFLQLYIYDTQHELQNRMAENPELHQTIVLKLQQILHRYNRFIHVFRQLALRPDVLDCTLLIKERPANQPQYSLPTASQVAAVIVGGDAESMACERDINVISHAGNLTKIQETVGFYDPLQYPLLLPFGTYGWDIDTRNVNGKKISCREYYSYMLQIRPNDQSVLLKAGRLLQQYVVDNYVKIESGRLRWVRSNQKTIRSELYQGLHDALHVGENSIGTH